MRGKFSRTLRHYMQDPVLYRNPGTHVWTPAHCEIADALLIALRSSPQATDDEICRSTAEHVHDSSLQDCTQVWARMQTYPYIFELAAIRGNIDQLALDGTQTITATHANKTRELSLACSTSARWRVPLADFAAFAEQDRLTPALFELFAINIRQRAPPLLSIGKWHQSRKLQFPMSQARANGTHLACFPFFSRVGYVTLYVLVNDNNDEKQLCSSTCYSARMRTTTQPVLQLHICSLCTR